MTLCSHKGIVLHIQEAGVSVTFINNSAGLGGAAIYASDLRLCSWVGNDYPLDNFTIFKLPEEIAHLSPFHYNYVLCCKAVE